jgi:hypothetical protein
MFDKTRPMPVLSVDWLDDGLGGIELILETDYAGFGFFEEAIDGIHRFSSFGPSGGDLVISQGVKLRVVCKGK